MRTACICRFTASGAAEFRAYVAGFKNHLLEPVIREALREGLEGCGQIKYISLHQHSKRSGEGYALVDFFSADDLNNALNMSGATIAGGPLHIKRYVHHGR